MAEHYIIDGKEHVYESAAEKHLTDKTITENGTYSAEDEPGDINGYKEVVVNVEGGGGQTETPIEKYAMNYNPTWSSSAVRSGGFIFSSIDTIKVTKIRIFSRITGKVDAHISDSVGNDLASILDADVLANEWNDLELTDPLIIPANMNCVVWCSHNDNTTLSYAQNVTPKLPFIQYKNGVYNTNSGVFPTALESNSIYAVDIYVESVIRDNTGIPLLSKSDWDELTTEEKQAYGLVAVQENDTGYIRGLLVSGEDYVDLFRIEQLNGISSTSRYNVIPVPDMNAVEFVFNDVESFGGMILSINPNIGTCNVKFELLSSTATVQFGNCTPGASLPSVISLGTNRKSYSTYSPYNLLSINPQDNNLFMGIYAPGGSYRMRISVSHP